MAFPGIRPDDKSATAVGDVPIGYLQSGRDGSSGRPAPEVNI